jgi:hypothetical protein
MITLAHKITAKNIINRKCHFDRISMIDHDRCLTVFSYRYNSLNRFNGISHAHPSLKYVSSNMKKKTLTYRYTRTRNEELPNLLRDGMTAISITPYSLTSMTYLHMR